MKVLIYSTKLKPQNHPYLTTLIQELESKNIEIAIYESYYEEIQNSELDFGDFPTISDYDELEGAGIDKVITLGGDGTILSAIILIRDLGIPIMGINLGRLGFLSNIEKSKISKAVDDLVRDDFIIETRSLIQISSNIPTFEDFPYALNDFTLHKRDTSSMVTIHAYVNGKFLNSYWADGIIVATPTGSTGYNLSCGGPIIFPDSGNFVITPVAPHNLNVRPIVLSDSSEVTFQIEGRSENFLCTLDSRYETVSAEHKITLKKSDFKVQFAHPRSIHFMKTIREKLMWGLDKRN